MDKRNHHTRIKYYSTFCTVPINEDANEGMDNGAVLVKCLGQRGTRSHVTEEKGLGYSGEIVRGKWKCMLSSFFVFLLIPILIP